MASGSSLPLVQSNFSQQGSLDWVGLADKTVSFSVGVLSRLAAAGIDLYTVVVGQMIAKDLPLSQKGLQNIQGAVSRPKCFPGFGDALWFGFGVKSFVNTLSTTDERTSLLALCATLSECFDETFAAGPFTWLHVVQACSGVLSASKFPLLIDGFLRLGPDAINITHRCPGSTVLTKRHSSRKRPSENDLAKIIRAIGQIASKELDAITISGGPAVGWVAAVSGWLFSLTVVIRDYDDKILFSNCASGSEAQVRIEFRSIESNCETSMDVTSKRYTLHSYHHLIVHDCSETRLVCGRVAWESCLRQTFGFDFQTLMEMPADVGTFMGCAARVLQDQALVDPTLLATRTGSELRIVGAYGQDLINHPLLLFPELASLRTYMEKGVRLSLTEAVAQYKGTHASISGSCNCRVCEGGTEKIRFCLTLIAEAILTLARILSRTSFSDGLCLVRRGIEIIYNEQLETKPRRLSSAWYEIESLLTCRPSEVRSRLTDVVILFTGDTPSMSRSEVNASALSRHGICVYSDILKTTSIHPDLIGHVTVIPGRIESNLKPFHLVKDRVLTKNVDSLHSQILQQSLCQIRNVTLSITERWDHLDAEYVLHPIHESQERPVIQCGPGLFVRQVLAARGKINCSHDDCGTTDPSIEKLIADLSSGKLEKWRHSLGPEIYVYAGHGYDDLSNMAIMSLVAKCRDDCLVLISDDQCIRCCAKYAYEHMHGPVLIVFPDRRVLEGGIVKQNTNVGTN